MQLTTSFHRIRELNHPVKIIQGSQGAGKTYSILLRWILMACTRNTPEVCSIVTDTLPALRSGAIRDFTNICTQSDIPFTGTKSPFIYKIRNWTFEFYSVDKDSKARGGRRHRLFINEANRMSWKTSQQLISRTHNEVIVDFNPVEEFWAHHNFVNVQECDFLKLTYKDNEQLPQREIESIERHAPWGSVPDENYWRVYGLGELGFVEGQIFKGYQKFTEYPEGNYIDSFGVDFGDVDPMTCVYVRHYPDRRELYWKELFYATAANIDDLALAILAHPGGGELPVFCDHDPKLIRMLRELGITAMNANKKGGLTADLRAIKQCRVLVHEDSASLIKEMDNYKYQFKNDMFIDYPDQRCSEHGIDAAKYGSLYSL
jgi:phage terminase large subunit